MDRLFSSTAARLAVLIVAMGLMAAALLDHRQARLQEAHDMSAALARARVLTDEAIRLRAEIATRVGEAVEHAGEDGGEEGRSAAEPIDLREPMFFRRPSGVRFREG